MRSAEVVIRPAAEADCRDIARFFVLGSQGLAELVWAEHRGPGETIIDVGARRCAGAGVPFSYENCVLAEVAGRTIALLHVYPTPAGAPPDPAAIAPVFRPFARLRDAGSLYLSALVVEREHRRRGIAWRLLQEAHRSAVRLGAPRLSVVVLERNTAAMRLYRRAGFREIDRAPLVPHPELTDWTGDALLLVKEADARM